MHSQCSRLRGGRIAPKPRRPTVGPPPSVNDIDNSAGGFWAGMSPSSLIHDAHGEAKRLDRFIAEWNRQQVAPNAERVARRHTLMTLIRHARQCRD
jgi:hypothetical protein